MKLNLNANNITNYKINYLPAIAIYFKIPMKIIYNLRHTPKIKEVNIMKK